MTDEVTTVTGYTNSNTITMENLEANNSSYPLSNIYDDNLDNYTEIDYTEKGTFAVLKVGSPTLTSLGVPSNAVITNIKLTEVSKRYYNSYYTPVINTCSLSINDTKYGTQEYKSKNSFESYVYTTGDININKNSIENDSIYFLLEYQNNDVISFRHTPKSYYWEISYKIVDNSNSIKLGSSNVVSVYVGSTKIKNVYKGDKLVI